MACDRCYYYLNLPGKKQRVSDRGDYWVRDNIVFPKDLFPDVSITTTKCVNCIKKAANQ